MTVILVVGQKFPGVQPTAAEAPVVGQINPGEHTVGSDSPVVSQ